MTAVRKIGRATQGVRLIRLDEEDKVVAAAKIAKEDGGDEDAPVDADETPTEGGSPAE